MSTILAGLLFVLVPAPNVEAEPNGVAPTLQFVKWNKGVIEQSVTVAVHVPVVESVTVNVNGVPQTQNITSFRTVYKTEKRTIDSKAVKVYSLDGKPVVEGDWQKILTSGAVVLLATNGVVPDAAYRKVIKDGTLIVVVKPNTNTTPPLPR